VSVVVPVSSTDKIISFADHARNNLEKGKITYERFCNIEMLELGYSPSDPKQVEEYYNLMEALSEEDFEMPDMSSLIFGPIEGEDTRELIVCPECNEKHLVGS
jgi:hypothetical protein